MTKDLIDRAALVAKLKEESETEWVGSSFDHREIRTGVRMALVCVESFPTVDAVEVIRCIDCRYACLVTDHDLQCLYDEDSLLHSHSHYCSYGERRTDGSTD